MNDVIRAAADLQAFCDAQHWRSCLIGGLAVLRWGEPRVTVDVGLTLLTGFSGEDRYVSTLLERFAPRIDDAAAFARVNRVLLLRASSGVGLDIALGGLPFEEAAVDRSTLFTFPPDAALRTCSAEDLLVLKAFAARPKDWVDIDGIIIRQAGGLDWDYVRSQLAPLAEREGCAGAPGASRPAASRPRSLTIGRTLSTPAFGTLSSSDHRDSGTYPKRSRP